MLDIPRRARRKRSAYADAFAHPYQAAERGFVDAVIDPADTRSSIAAALSMLATKQGRHPPRVHDNMPL